MKSILKIVSMILTAVLLASSLVYAAGEDAITLKDSSCYRVSENGEYIVGIEGIPEVDFVLSQFNRSDQLSIVTHNGEVRTGSIASDDEIVYGDSHIKLLVYGDVDRSAELNARDVIGMMKYLCGVESDICELAVDVSADSKINSRDVVLLMKYLVGADVVLGDITYPSVEFKIDSSYKVVLGENADETEEEAAALLCTALDSLYGHGLGTKRIITDKSSAENEIIIGKCNRQFYSKDRSKLSGDGYFYDVIKPSRIVIAGSDSEGTYEAVKRFLWDTFAYIDKFNTVNSAKIFDGTNYVDVKGSTVVTSSKSFFFNYPDDKAEISLNGVPIRDYTIVPKDDHFVACATILNRNIRLLTGKSLTVDESYSGERAIYVGRIADGGNYSSAGLAYNIGREGDSIYIDAYRLNVCRFAVRAFSNDYLLKDFTDRDISVSGNQLGIYNSNRLKLTDTTE